MVGTVGRARLSVGKLHDGSFGAIAGELRSFVLSVEPAATPRRYRETSRLSR
ncbi:hypothetical protein AKJ09_07533 [Labilithrix luteola]|uniref:Uncharacterized protein n=1 Tax=Labilithrix luteola TaxID=1391654 RepID=A0A0K1Q641_9BACT|nr:hypothetical protein AKJ09_07533 [Labilithrix luteola]